MLKFRDLHHDVYAARGAAYDAALKQYKVVRNRGGALLCTATAKGEQCEPNVAADCPFWDYTKRSVVALVDDVKANHPEVEYVYIEGAYDGADERVAFKDGYYDCRVEEWSVQVWSRTLGYAVRESEVA